MRFIAVVLVSILLASCEPLPKQTAAEAAAMEIETNEALAESHLRSIVSAQSQVKALCVVDTDQDGSGEFLFLDELSGARPARAPGAGLRVSLLIGEFKRRGVGGYVDVHGYLYRLFLKGPDGRCIDEGKPDTGMAEMQWCCYAWPAAYGRTGRRSFYVNEYGIVRAEEAPALSGAHAPDPETALGESTDRSSPAWKPSGPPVAVKTTSVAEVQDPAGE